jgi:hypothetical protein
VYRGSTDDATTGPDDTSFDAENVTDASGRLVVAEAGYVRKRSLSLTADVADGKQQGELPVTTTGVNETTVEEPEWTDEA